MWLAGGREWGRARARAMGALGRDEQCGTSWTGFPEATRRVLRTRSVGAEGAGRRCFSKRFAILGDGEVEVRDWI